MLFSAQRADAEQRTGHHHPSPSSSSSSSANRHRERANFPFDCVATSRARRACPSENSRTFCARRANAPSGGVIFARSARLAAWRSLKANGRQLWSTSSAPTVRQPHSLRSLRPPNPHRKPIMSLERAVRAKVSEQSAFRESAPRQRSGIFISRSVYAASVLRAFASMLL